MSIRLFVAAIVFPWLAISEPATAASDDAFLRIQVAEAKPEVPLDRQGHKVPYYQWESFWCSSKWDEECGGEAATFEITEGYEYCVHYLRINEWNHAGFWIGNIRPGYLDIDVFSSGSKNFFDRTSGAINATLVVGAVPIGEYSTERCLPRRDWRTYCNGLEGYPWCHESHCALMKPVDIVRDADCRNQENSP